MEIKNEKILDRKKFHQIRKQSTNLEKSNVEKNVETFIDSIPKEILFNKYIGIYWPIKNEVDIRKLRNKYPVALPKCQTNLEIQYFIWDNTPLKKDIQGIPSPNNNLCLSHENISMIFVPCLSIDKRLTRLGYGGGYFDKLRSKKDWNLIPCIGILTDNCVSNNLLNKEKWDIPLNGYITEKEILI